ncbi:hypothetical protein OQA88_2667 [Cercophora sp. LCS_1]
MASLHVAGMQRAERADRIPDATWEENKVAIESLYRQMRLEDLIKHMEDEYGFKATSVKNHALRVQLTKSHSEQQYKIQFNKWGLRKNKRRNDQRSPSPEGKNACQISANSLQLRNIDLKRRPAPPPPAAPVVEALMVGAPLAHASAQPGVAMMPVAAPTMATGMMSSNGITQGATLGPQAWPWQQGTGYAYGVGTTRSYPYFGVDPSLMPMAESNTMLGATMFGAELQTGSGFSTQGGFMHSQGQMYATNVQPVRQNAIAQANLQISQYNLANDRSIAMQNPNSSNNTTSRPLSPPIHNAIRSGSLRGVKMLLNADHECVHSLCKNGFTTVHWAAEGGHLDILKLLIQCRADPSIPNNKGIYPLGVAALNGHLKVVELLLQNGVEPDSAGEYGCTPLWCASQNGHEDVVNFLLDHKGSKGGVNVEAEWRERERRAIHQAANNGHTGIVRALLSKGAEVDPWDVDGATPLWNAAQKGHSEVVRMLLEAGADANVALHDSGYKVIHAAAQSGNIEVVRALLERGVDSKPEEEPGDDADGSPFLLACGAKGDPIELVNLLVSKGVNLSQAARLGGWGALHFAASAGNLSIGRLLLDKNLYLEVKDNMGWTPIILAACQGHTSFVDLLLDRHADLNCQTAKEGATALYVAAQSGHVGLVKRLLEAKAKQLPTNTGYHPLHIAAQNGHLGCVKLLLDDSPQEVNLATEDGRTPLSLAAVKCDQPGKLAVMKYLLSRGAKANA